MSSFTEYFVENIDNISEGFIKFCSIDTHVKSAYFTPDLPLYFGIDNGIDDYRLSHVTIDQIQDNQLKHIAWFYKTYNYTRGIGELIQNPENINYYRFITKGKYFNENDRSFGFNMVVDLYIDRLFILNMYEQSEIPELLYAIILDSRNNMEYSDKLEIKKENYC